MPPTIPQTLITTLKTHTAPINAITFSSQGGQYILTGSSDRSIHLSRTEASSTSNPTVTTTPIQSYSSHGYAVLDIAVSQSNQHFASVGGDRSVFLWDVSNASGTLRRLGSASADKAHKSRITCVSFAGADDSVVVSGSDDRSVRVWDMRSRDVSPLMVMEEAKDGVSCLFIPTGTEIVAGSIDGRVRAYDVRMGRVVVDVMSGAVTCLEGTRDGKAMLVSTLDSKIRLMDREDGGCLRVFPSADDRGEEAYKNENLRLKSCFAKNESLILSGSEDDGLVRAWDVLNGKMVESIDVCGSQGDKKIISLVKWREGSQAASRRGLWAAGGTEGVVRIYGD